MVDVELKDGVARIFLNRPEKVNALTSGLLSELREKIQLLHSQPVHVAVLAGRGKAFCGGADVNELRTLTRQNAGAFVEKIHRVCRAIRELPAPVVAGLHGAVIGGGLEIAAACDLRVAAPGTRFAMPEVKLAIPSVVEAALLPRLMGGGRAAWLVLTGATIDAEKALQWGLIEEVGNAEPLVQQLLACDAAALKAQKRLLQLWEEAPLATSIPDSIEAFARAHVNK
jgi:enoyl-CoA hydratase/carnithine racemase